MIPEEFRGTGYQDYHVPLADTVHAIDEDEFFLDPSRMTLLCGHAGFDGSELKELLADKYDIQVNKTSRNSVLIQININNSRSDMAILMQTLMEMSLDIDNRLRDGGEAELAKFQARVKALVEDVPDLPNFSNFHRAFRDDPESETKEGHMREAYYMAYKEENLEHIPLVGKEIEHRLKQGPSLVSAKFVIPYPPGFPIMVPGQIITAETVTFMRKLDVKEIHGYNADRGLELLKVESPTERQNGNDENTSKEDEQS